MNRELKFRVWDKLSKRYLEITPFSRHHYVLDLEGNFMNLQNGSGGDEYLVEQYTGLKDKTGKEIYEGDLVKHRNDWECPQNTYLNDGVKLITGEIYGDYPILGFKFIRPDMADLETGVVMNVMHGRYTQVIGNINENPELLENMS